MYIERNAKSNSWVSDGERQWELVYLIVLIRNIFGVSVVKIITHFYKESFVKYEVIKYPISFLRNIKLFISGNIFKMRLFFVKYFLLHSLLFQRIEKIFL